MSGLGFGHLVPGGLWFWGLEFRDVGEFRGLVFLGFVGGLGAPGFYVLGFRHLPFSLSGLCMGASRKVRSNTH